jgi:hypothetical protein
MERYAGLPPLPLSRIDRLQRAGSRPLVELEQSARQVFRGLDYPLWRATAHNPVRMLRMIPQESWSTLRRTPTFSHATTRRSPTWTPLEVAADTWWARNFPDVGSESIAYFSAEFRAAPVAADLCRRPRGPRRRSLQGSQRPRRTADRHRLHVSAGLLPPARVGRRMAGRIVRKAELGRCADRAGHQP